MRTLLALICGILTGMAVVAGTFAVATGIGYVLLRIFFSPEASLLTAAIIGVLSALGSFWMGIGFGFAVAASIREGG